MAFDVWDRSRLSDVMAIVDAAMPAEALTDDDIAANLFDDPDPVIVIGNSAADAVAAAVVRTPRDGRQIVHVQLLAVAPEAQRAGLGSAAAAEIQGWAFDAQDAAAVVVGAGAPFYLFAGVDVRATPALCLFESLGYRPRGAELNLSFPSRFRAPPPAGITLRRVLDTDDERAVVEFCGQHWPNWVPELRRGIEHAACHIAIDEEGSAAGFGCHSVNRVAWLGPIATDPVRQRGGVGSALMSAISKDVMAAGFDAVEVSWIGPIGFYAKAAGASVSRVFRSLVLPRA